MWEEHATDDGLKYWYNAATGESQWMPPGERAADGRVQDETETASPSSAAVAESSEEASGTPVRRFGVWEECQAADGQTFYFNTDTGASSWDQPLEANIGGVGGAAGGGGGGGEAGGTTVSWAAGDEGGAAARLTDEASCEAPAPDAPAEFEVADTGKVGAAPALPPRTHMMQATGDEDQKEDAPSVRGSKPSSAPTSTLSEINRQMRKMRAELAQQTAENDRLQRQLKIMADIRGVPAEAVQQALHEACEREAGAENHDLVRKLQSRAEAAEAAMSKRKPGEAKIEHELASLEVRYQELSEAEAALRAQNEDLYGRLGGAEQARVELEAAVAASRAEIAAATTAAAAATSSADTIAAAEAEALTAARVDVARLTGELGKCESLARQQEVAVERLKASEQRLKLRGDQQETRLGVQEERIKDLGQQLASLYSAYGLVESDMKQSDEEARRLRAEQDRAQEEADRKLAMRLSTQRRRASEVQHEGQKVGGGAARAGLSTGTEPVTAPLALSRAPMTPTAAPLGRSAPASSVEEQDRAFALMLARMDAGEDVGEALRTQATVEAFQPSRQDGRGALARGAGGSSIPPAPPIPAAAPYLPSPPTASPVRGGDTRAVESVGARKKWPSLSRLSKGKRASKARRPLPAAPVVTQPPAARVVTAAPGRPSGPPLPHQLGIGRRQPSL